MGEYAVPSVVGVLGSDADRLVDALEDRDATVLTGGVAELVASDADVVVTTDEAALLELVADGSIPAVPVLPVDADVGVPSVPAGDAIAAVDSLCSGTGSLTSVPVLEAASEGRRLATALCECFLVTAEHARISEFTVESDDRVVDRFRADGVVVATPAGSHGYARTVGGPRVAPSAAVAAVVPVAPFATDPDHWVLPIDDVSLRVARDEVPVELLADDRVVGTVPPDEPIAVRPTATLSVLSVPTSRGPVDDPADAG